MSPQSEKLMSANVSEQLQTDQDDANDSDRDGKIRDRAYELYLERGQEAGHELDDWLQAEGEIDQ